MTPSTRGSGLLAFVTLIALAPRPARAEPSADDKARGEAIFRAAQDDLKRGAAAEACPKLENVVKLTEGLGARLELAKCYATVGRTASAWAVFREVQAKAQAAGQAERAIAAAKGAADLETKLVTLRIDVAKAARVPGFAVTRNGLGVSEAEWGIAVPVDPGEQAVEARAPGRRPFVQRVDVRSGPVELTVPSLEFDTAPVTKPPPERSDSTPPAQPSSPHTETPPDGSYRRTLGYVGLGLGGGGFVLGTVFLLKASSKNREYQTAASSAQTAGRCDAACQSEVGSLKSDRDGSATVSFVAFGLGGALAIGGGILLLNAPAVPVSVTPVASHGRGGVVVHGSF